MAGGLWWRLPIISVLEITLYCLLGTLNILLIHYIYKNSSTFIPYKLDYVLYAGFVYRALYFMLLGTGYYFLMNYIRSREQQVRQEAEVEVLKKQLVQAKLDFLRSQVNPHLLFNTLSFVQQAAKTRPKEAEEAMQCLSRLMGFALDEYNHDGVPLHKEIEQAENIIRIHQLRFEDSLKLEYTKEISHDRMTVLPLTFVSLVENLFKHGHPVNARLPAAIKVYATESRAYFETTNLPRPTPLHKQNHRPSGLKNIRERLEKACPGRHVFEYGMDGELFKTRLEIWNDA